MKKQISIILLLCCYGMAAKSQSAFVPPSTYFENSSISFDSAVEVTVDQLNLIFPSDSEEGGPNRKFARWTEFWGNRMSNDVSTSVFKPEPANVALKTVLGNLQSCTPAGNWTCIGPFNDYFDNTTSSVTERQGRINQVWISPGNSNVILAGSDGGGLWKSTNGGVTWQNITDGAGLNNYLIPGTLGIHSLAVDPIDNDRIYLATGVFCLFDINDWGYGLGMLYTTDGGVTWQEDTDIQSLTGGKQGATFKKIAYFPGTHEMLTIWDNKVLYKAGTSSSAHWTDITPSGLPSGVKFNDFEFDPSNSDIAVFSTNAYNTNTNATLWKLDKSTGTWSSISAMTAPTSTTLTTGIVDITIASSGVVFALVPLNNANTLWSTSLSTANWQQVNSSLGCMDGINVSTANAQIIYSYCGAGTPFRVSTDGGATFTSISGSTHADGRFLTIYSPTTSTNGINDVVYGGTDGGVVLKRSGTATFSSITGAGLCVTQFYGFSGSDADDRLIVGGAQDNSQFDYVRHRTIPWRQSQGGDGYPAKFANNGVLRALGAGNYPTMFAYDFTTNLTNAAIGTTTNPPDNDCVSCFPCPCNNHMRPIVYSTSSTPYVGYREVYSRPVASGGAWSRAFARDPNILRTNNDPVSNKVGAIKFSSQDSNFAYMCYRREAFGDPTGNNQANINRAKLFLSTNAFQTNLPVRWKNITPPAVEKFRIMDVEIDPKRPERIWVALGNVDGTHANTAPIINGNDTLKRVFYSPDSGTSWKNVSIGLSALPVNKIIYQEGSDDILFAGTDAGVFRWNKAAHIWECFNGGMPPNIVMDLEMNYCSGKLRAGTYGRGIWETDIVIPNNGPDTIKTNTTWNTTRVIKGDIYVKPGVRLTITNNGNNWPRILMGKDAQILVAGELYIDSATISNNCGPCMWKGIKLLGNDTNQSLNGSIVLNNATIEHAIEAIESTGGAISSARSSYINNSRSIYIHNYTGAGIVKYNANFTKDTFVVTDGFRGGAAHYFRSHVELNHVKNGARFMGCRFLNNFTADYWGTCTGVQAINAGFSVEHYCTTPVAPCASGNTTPSSFRGFRNGVWVESIEQDRPAKIIKSIFDSCSIGVRLFNSAHTTVAQNSFTVGTGREVDLSLFDCDKNIGIYATGAEYPVIEENEFTGELPSNPSTNFERIGTVLENCVKNIYNENYITVYKNDFDGLEKACVSIGRNKSEDQMGNTLPGGLRYICNNFTNNDADIYVISDGSGANRQGIQYYHRGGDPTTSSVICSGNEFNNGSATHISGDAARMLYFNDGNGFRNPTNISSNVMLTTMSVSTNSCPSKYGALIDAPLDELIPDLKDLGKGQGILADTKTGDYEAQIDGGNTAGLIAYLGTKTSAESDEVYTTMWGYSPWLSQDALYTLAQSSILDADSLTEIMMANPEALTPEFVDELEILSPQPFMPEHFTQMDAAPGIFTARTTLLAEIATAKAEKDYYTSFLMSVMLDEDTIEADSVIAWYDYTNTVAAEYAKASFYASIGDYVSGEAVLTNLPSKFSLNTQQTTDHNAYSSLYTMLKSVAMDDRTTKQLNSTELGQLATWASNSSLGVLVKNPVTVLSDNLGDMARMVCVDLYSSSGKQAPKTRLSAYSRGLNSVVRAYPNPANEQVTFDYRLPRMEKNTVLVVNDITGREVYQMRLDKPTGTALWNTRLLAPGVYIYRIRDAHSIIETGRISISR